MGKFKTWEPGDSPYIYSDELVQQLTEYIEEFYQDKPELKRTILKIMKGKPDLRVSNEEYRKNYERIFEKECKGCNKALCSCKLKKVPKN